MKTHILVALLLSAGCSKSASDPIVNVGSFTVPVPEAWHNVTDAKMESGSIALQTLKVGDRKTKPPVTIMMHPVPEPLTRNPAEAAACTAHAASLALDVSKAEVITLPAGKACAVEASKGDLQAMQIVLVAQGHAIMANCTYRGSDKTMCDEMFARIALRDGVAAAAEATSAVASPPPPAEDASAFARKPTQRVVLAGLGLSIEVPEGTTPTPPRDADEGARRVNLRQGAFMVNVHLVDKSSVPSFAKAKEIYRTDKLVEWIRADETPTGWITFKQIASDLYKSNRFELEVRTEIGRNKWDCSISAPSRGLADLALTACQTLKASEPTSGVKARPRPARAESAAKSARTRTARLESPAPTVNGAASKDVISRVVRQQFGRIRACYERALIANPALTTTITTKFVIGGNGRVSAASSSGGDAQVSACLATVFRGMQFPAPKDGGTVTASYPIRFAPN